MGFSGSHFLTTYRSSQICCVEVLSMMTAWQYRIYRKYPAVPTSLNLDNLLLVSPPIDTDFFLYVSPIRLSFPGTSCRSDLPPQDCVMGSPPPPPPPSLRTAWKVVLGIMGDKKRLKRTGFVRQPVLKKCRESCVVMCFLCQGRQKMSEQVHVCSWAACQLSPFAVTHQPVSHYGGCCGLSPLSFGRALQDIMLRHHDTSWRQVTVVGGTFIKVLTYLVIRGITQRHAKVFFFKVHILFVDFLSDLYLHKV